MYRNMIPMIQQSELQQQLNSRFYISAVRFLQDLRQPVGLRRYDGR